MTREDPYKGSTFGNLTPRQERFVREYIRIGNAKRAATLAGFSPRSAKQIGYTLLQKPEVQQALEALREAEAPAGQELTPDRALRMLVEETADPNPRVRLDAKKAVAQAVGVFSQKDQQPQGCPACARREALEALPDEDLELRVAGTNRSRVLAMSRVQFERWAVSVRAEAERWVTTARGIREGVPAPGSDPNPEGTQAKPDGPSETGSTNR